MQHLIERLQDHTIFCGYGRVARFAAQELLEANHPLVIVDRSPGRVEEATQAGFLAMAGDASTEATLLQAGIKRAKCLVTVLPKDADNLYVVLTAKELNPELFIISRADDEGGEKRLSRAGAQKIISPYRVGGQKIAHGLLRPYVTDFLDLASPATADGFLIEELRIPDDSPLIGTTLQDAGIRSNTNIIVAALISKSGKMEVNPSADTTIEPGSTMIGLGKRSDFVILEKMLVKS